MPMTLPIKLKGITKHYSGNGRNLGYPTANIDAATDLADGVYFGYSDLGTIVHHQPALIFIGTPTTVGDTERRIEAHILDLANVDYYDQELTLYVQKFHRPNKTFNSVDELLIIMKDDEKSGRDWFVTHT